MGQGQLRHRRRLTGMVAVAVALCLALGFAVPVLSGLWNAGGYGPADGGPGWRRLPDPPVKRTWGAESAVWTGKELLAPILWGGAAGSREGYAFNPAANRWRRMADAPVTNGETGRFQVGVWTGRELIVVLPSAAVAYDPAVDRWRRLRPPPFWTDAPSIVSPVWTGEKLLLWVQDHRRERPGEDNRGLAYDPAVDRWQALPRLPGIDPGIDRVLTAHTAWTGRQFLVVLYLVVGDDEDRRLAGATYDPATGDWARIPDAPAAARRFEATPVWTGEELILWGGFSSDDPAGTNDGYAYNPSTRAWRRLPPSPVSPRKGEAVSWTGHELILWSGALGEFSPSSVGFEDPANELASDGAAYNPATNTWRRLSRSPITPRQDAAAVWSGQEVLIIGGNTRDKSGLKWFIVRWLIGDSDDPDEYEVGAYTPATDQPRR
jgi:Galactose oxidase, central domain